MSPYFWLVYVDDKLRKSGSGCFIKLLFVACIFYADVVALLSPTVHGMQKLIDICSSYGHDSAITYNFKKTKVMFFGKTKNLICPNSFKLNGAQWPPGNARFDINDISQFNHPVMH